MAAKPLPEQLRQRDRDRMRAYADNLAFYRGAQWTISATEQLTRRGRRQITMNYAKAFIVKATSYTIDGLTIVADPLADDQQAIDNAAEIEAALRSVADANALDVLDFDNELDCSVLGDAAYKVTWDDAGERVRITSPDVTSLYAWRRPDDPNELWRVAQQYVIDSESALALYGIRGRKSTVRITEDWTRERFTLYADSDVAQDGPNPYGAMPYIIYPNVREPMQQWGASDIPQLREAARELNRLATQLSLIAELSGNPIAVLTNVTESENIAAQPGAVWDLPKDARAELLDLLKGGGAGVLMEWAQFTRSILHDLGESPRSAFGDNARGLSGVALNVELDPLVKKVRRKRLIRARAFAQRNALVLRLMADHGQLADSLADHPTRTAWGDVLPNDRTREVADAVALTNAAIASRRRAAKDLGYDDPDSELAQWLEESGQINQVEATKAPTPNRPAPLSA